MSYRVECAVSGRAVCKATECQEAQMKIAKDDLRLGSWVPYEDRGSWAWKHWGCVTGKQLENIRKAIRNPAKPGEYLWDMLDGYDSGDKGSLDNHPDLQEKVRRVVTQGFIDPEDFNGDPEMNKLGEAGIRTAESKKQMREDKKARKAVIEELESKLAAAEAEIAELKAKGDAGVKKAENLKEEVKSELEAKKEEKKATVSVKRVKNEDADEEVKEPLKKKRATKGKGVKKEEEDSDAGPAASTASTKKRAPAKKSSIKNEPQSGDDVAPAVSAPKKRPSRATAKKSAIKDEPNSDDDEEARVDAAPIVKKRAPRGKKGKAPKEDIVVYEDEGFKKDETAGEDVEEEAEEEAEYKPRSKRGRRKA